MALVSYLQKRSPNVASYGDQLDSVSSFYCFEILTEWEVDKPLLLTLSSTGASLTTNATETRHTSALPQTVLLTLVMSQPPDPRQILHAIGILSCSPPVRTGP